MNKNWLKIMFYNFIQQIICQNFQYWFFYVCFWFDRNIQLINYLYYVKFVKSENYTFFKHIDINVFMYVKNDRGSQIIQNSMSLNNENVMNCIKIVFEFHRHIKNWWKRIERRKICLNNWMHSLKKIYVKKNVEIYENFILVLCLRENVQITMLKILHESIHNIKNIKRKIMFSWFVEIWKNEKTLNNKKFDNLTKLQLIHKQQIAFALTSSNLFNCYDVISDKFFFRFIWFCKIQWTTSLCVKLIETIR